MPSRTWDRSDVRSDLELFAANALEKEGIKFDYEVTVELAPPFTYKGVCVERTPGKKQMRVRNDKYQRIIYTPDFVGKDWIMETKGVRRPDFDLRWKIFKETIKGEGWLLLLPSNQLDVLASIEIIKKWVNGDRQWDNKRLLQEYEDIKLTFVSSTKSKTAKTKERSSGTVQRRRRSKS